MPKTYQSHHINYSPFVRYIENHIGIDDPTVQRAKAKLGTIKSNQVSDNKTKKQNKNNKMAATVTSSFNNKQIFSDQMGDAMTKAEKDDARHADLHANVKTKDMTDSDKIFLLKREIDNLQDQIKGGQGTVSSTSTSKASSSNSSFITNVPMLSALLFFGVVLVSARFLSKKLRAVRNAGSLLLDGENGDDRNYEYNQNNNNTEMGFELGSMDTASSTSQPPQGGIFSKIASTLHTAGSNVATNTALAGMEYSAPPEQASVQFV